MEGNTIYAALLGLGTVGGGVYKVLKSQEPEMENKLGVKVKLKKILVRNLEKAAGKWMIRTADQFLERDCRGSRDRDCHRSDGRDGAGENVYSGGP